MALRHAAMICALAALYGCEPGPARIASPIPILDLEAAERSYDKDLYKALAVESFEKALVRYPSSRRAGDIFVPVGGHFTTTLINALPDDDRVSLIRLDRFESVCGGRSFYMTANVRCSVDIDITVVVGLREHLVTIDGEKDVGPVLVVGDRSRAFAKNDVGIKMLYAKARVVSGYAASRAAEKIRSVLEIPTPAAPRPE